MKRRALADAWARFGAGGWVIDFPVEVRQPSQLSG